MTDEDDTPALAGEAKSSDATPSKMSWLSAGLTGTKLLVGVGTALVLLALNVVQFVYVLNPRLRPDPNERLHATLHALRVERRVYIGDYFERVTSANDLDKVRDDATRATLDAKDPSPAEIKHARPRAMCREGVAIYVDLTVDGLKRRQVELASFLYRARDRRRVIDDQQVLPPRRLASPTDSFVEAVWVDQPPDPSEKYYVRLELRTVGSKESKGTLLVIGDSTRFSGWAPDVKRCLRDA